MKITSQASDIQQQVKVNSRVQSVLGVPSNFSSYLKTQNAGGRLAVQAPGDMQLPEIDRIAKQMWGTAYDLATHTVRLDAFTRHTEDATAAFARKLGGLLRSVGVDTTQAIELNVGQNESVHVAGNHPYKSQIERYLAENPLLGEEFSRISNDNDTVALGKLAGEYGKRWEAARTPAQRRSVVSYFSSLLDQARRLGGQMTLSMDRLSSASLTYAIRTGKG